MLRVSGNPHGEGMACRPMKSAQSGSLSAIWACQWRNDIWHGVSGSIEQHGRDGNLSAINGVIEAMASTGEAVYGISIHVRRRVNNGVSADGYLHVMKAAINVYGMASAAMA